MPPPEPKKPVRLLPVLRAYARATFRYKWMFLFILVGIVVVQATVLAMPLYLKKLIDTLSESTPSAEAVPALLLIVGTYAGLAALNWVGRRLDYIAILKIEANVMADLANEAFGYLLHHSYDFFASNFAGSLTRRVTRYSRAYEQILDSFALNFFPTSLFAIGSMWVLYTRNHWLGLALLVWTVTFITVQLLLLRWIQPLRAERTAQDTKITGALSDVIANQSAVKLFAAEESEKKSFSSIVEAWRSATVRTWTYDAIIQAVQHALSVIIVSGLFTGGVILWSKGIITIGDFVLIQVYVVGLIDQVWNISNIMRRVHDGIAEASEMLDIMDQPHGVRDASNALPLPFHKGEIEFDKVSFRFNQERAVLEDFSLHIAGGEKIALVGASGAGKSTVTKLLLRLYDVSSGAVRIDGSDLRSVTQHSLHKTIGFVPQEPILFHRSLRENIAYGRPDASEEEIIAAAKKAHCHEFISALPKGYDTFVGERGVKLSGGERQRVAIARAILKNAPILVLDEATSSLDSESEALIQEALGKLMEGKTVIAIAHRLSTIMKMDRIIVMEQGRALLAGTHEELLSQGSNLYKKLWEIQAGGFIHE